MLEKKQIRKTPFRLEVLKLFKASKNAISLKEIEKNLTSFDRITLYRTLKLFIEKGLIHEVCTLVVKSMRFVKNNVMNINTSTIICIFTVQVVMNPFVLKHILKI